jgi:hypothetical protein
MPVEVNSSTIAANGAGLRQAERVIDSFIAPSNTFTDILRSTSWWLPFLLASVLSIAATFVIQKQVGWDTVVQNSVHSNPKQEAQLAELEPGRRATQIHAMAVGFKYSSYMSPLIILLFTALGALGLWASFNFGLGARTTFGQMFAVWMYASMPRLLSSLLMMVTLFLGGNAEGFDMKNPVGTNPGFYLPDVSPWLRTLLGFADVIGLWSLALLVIGTAIVAKVKRGQAAMVVVGWWALILIVSVIVSAVTS